MLNKTGPYEYALIALFLSVIPSSPNTHKLLQQSVTTSSSFMYKVLVRDSGAIASVASDEF